jgi:hypothetical protein
MTLASKSKAGPQVSGIIRVYSLCTNSEFNHVSVFVQSFTLSSLLCHKWNISLNHGPGEENNHINFQFVVADIFFPSDDRLQHAKGTDVDRVLN